MLGIHIVDEQRAIDRLFEYNYQVCCKLFLTFTSGSSPFDGTFAVEERENE